MQIARALPARAVRRGERLGGVRRRAQQRWLHNPVIEDFQETEMSCFPVTDQPKVLYTGKRPVRVGYVLQREPVVTKEVHPMQQDFEKDIKAEMKKYQRLPSGLQLPQALKKLSPEAYKTLASHQPVYWQEPKYAQQELTVLKSFKLGQRVTALDIEDTSSRRSLNRKLQERLFLIVKKDGVWQVPSIDRKQGESLRTTLQRGVDDDHLEAIDFQTISNAPSAHVFEADGAVTAIFSVYYLSGLPKLDGLQDSSSYAWVTRNELREYTFPSLAYKRAVYSACYDDYMPHLPIFAN